MYNATKANENSINEIISGDLKKFFNTNIIIKDNIAEKNTLTKLNLKICIFVMINACIVFIIDLIINETDVAIAAPIIPNIGIK